jgi:uncharacterized protein YebE (UPF0316 family)
MIDLLFQGQLFTWLVLPLLIFVARVADVSIGTMRIVFVSRGHRFIAPMLGFIEVIIWLLALTRIMQNLGNPVTYIAYGAGFAAGNYLGIVLEDKLAMGVCVVRTITRRGAGALVDALRKENFGVTVIDAQGNMGRVAVFYSVLKRADVPRYVDIIHHYNPKAFYSVEDVRFVKSGIFPDRGRLLSRPLRKGK